MLIPFVVDRIISIHPLKFGFWDSLYLGFFAALSLSSPYRGKIWPLKTPIIILSDGSMGCPEGCLFFCVFDGMFCLHLLN